VNINLNIFASLFEKRPEISRSVFQRDLENYFFPFAQKLIDLKKAKTSSDGLIVGVSAIQGAGKTTQGEIMELLLSSLGYSSLSLSIDDHYITHQQLVELRKRDPRYIRRGVTHDINLAISDLKNLQEMKDGETITIARYDKGAYQGDGERFERRVSFKPDFIFYDGWMLGVRTVTDESIFSSGLPALETSESQQFARDINKKLTDYEPLWDLFDFMNVLYVPNYQISLAWREQAEQVLRNKGEGMTPEQIKEFVYYFWRSVHPAVQIKNLASDPVHAQQVVIISDDHSIEEVISAAQAREKYS